MLHTVRHFAPYVWQVTRFWTFDTFLRQGYELFTNNSGVPQLFNGTNYTVNYTSYPWGLGAWGTPLRTSKARRADQPNLLLTRSRLPPAPEQARGRRARSE